MRCPDLRSRNVRRASGETRPLVSAKQPEMLSKSTATDTRIKLHFDGVLGQQLAEYGLDRCW